MGNVMGWSLPLGRLFGITIRVHVLFPFVALGLILRAAFTKDAPPDTWIHATVLMGLLLVAVLLHELGHCFGARLVDGDAHEVILWPLGGLASVDVPHTARANFLTALAGPLVNLLLCIAAGSALIALAVRPPLSPLWIPIQIPPELYAWDGTPLKDPSPWLL